MKKLLLAIGVALLLLLGTQQAMAQSSSLWKIVGTRLMPVIRSWKVTAPGGFSGSSLRVDQLRNCSALETNGAGTVACGTDDTGAGASNFGSGNVLTILQATDNATSTGHLIGVFSNIFLATSTGSLETYFDTLYNPLGSGGGNFGTGNVLTINQATDNATSTGHLISTFKNIFLASSTGSLKGYFDLQYLRTSTGSLKSYFDLQYLRTSTGSLKVFFDSQYLRTSTGSLQTFFDGLYFRTSTGSLEAYFDTLYDPLGGASGISQADGDARYVNTSGDTMTGKLLINLTAGTDGLEVIQNMSGGTLAAVQGLFTVTGTSFPALDMNYNSGSNLFTVNNNTLLFSDSHDASRFEVDTSIANRTDLSMYSPLGNSLVLFSAHETATTSFDLIGAGGSVAFNSIGGFGAMLSITSAAQDVQTLPLFKMMDVGNSTLSYFTGSAALVINDINADDIFVNFKGDTDSNMFFANPATDRIGIGTSAPDAKLEVIGTASGVVVRGQKTVASSGTLVWEGTASGSQIRGLGLVDCDTAATSKLLWDTTSGTFLCGTDQNSGGGGSNFGSGNVLTILQATDNATSTGHLIATFKNIFLASSTGSLKTYFDANYLRTSTGSLKVFFDTQYLRTSTGSLKTLFDSLYFRSSTGSLQTFFNGLYLQTSTGSLEAYFDTLYDPLGAGGDLDMAFADTRYVNDSGDTMTGALNFLITGGTNNSVALELPHTASGRILHAQDLLRSSGALALEGGFFQTGLADCDNAGEKPVYNLATGLWSCGTDDDVPESGDFAAGVDLEADGSLSADVIADAEMADNDFGDWTCATGNCTLDADTVSTAEMADADHGDFTYSGGAATLDADVVAAAEMADADHGDISWSGGVASIDADTVGQAEVAGNALDFAELQDALDVDAATTITLGTNDLDIIATSTGQFEILGTASGRIIHAQDQLRSSGSLVIEGSAALDATTVVLDAANNRLGILTASPQQALHVVGTSRFEPGSNEYMEIQGNSNEVEISTEATSHMLINSAGYIKAQVAGTSDYFQVQQGANLVMKVEGDGDVGIGKAPEADARLRVYESGSSAADWKGRIVAGGDTVAFLMGERNSLAWLGGHNAALNAWADLYLSPDGNEDLFLGDSNDSGETPTPIISISNNTEKVGVNTANAEALVQITGGGLCVGSDANCNTDNNTEGIVYSSATAMTIYDVAERYPTKDKALSGATVLLALDLNNPVFVKKAEKGDKLIGIHSLRPAIDLGGFKTEETQFRDEYQVSVALVGRVPLHVTTENGEINVGDEITISSEPGVGMKADQKDQSVGYALEPCKKGNKWWKPWATSECSIQVFVRLSR